MVIVYGKYRFVGMSIFPFMFIDEKYRDRDELLRHEAIHGAQQVEVTISSIILCALFGFPWYIGLITFYVMYFTEWIIRTIIEKDFSIMGAGYRKISFEQEAYSNQEDSEYEVTRLPFNWITYLWQR